MTVHEAASGGEIDLPVEAVHDPDYRPPSIADGTVSEGLIAVLRAVGDEWGPLGVALAAAELAGMALVQHDEWCDVACPHDPALSGSTNAPDDGAS